MPISTKSSQQYRNIYFPMIRLDPAEDKNGVPIKDLPLC